MTMKKNLLLIAILMLALVTSTTKAWAQPKPAYSVTSKKAIKQYEEALGQYDQRQYAEAASTLEDLTKSTPDFIEAWYMLAQVYDDMRQPEKTIAPLERALAVNEKFYPEGWLMLSESHFGLGNYADAEKAVSRYMPFPHATPELEKRAQVILSSCVFAKNAMASPVPFNPINLGPEVNSENNEYYPCITADETTLLFTRLVPTASAYSGKQEDFFISKKQGGKWITAAPVVEINTPTNEGAPSLSADGQTLIFTACETGDGMWGGNREGIGSCDLFFSVKSGNNWQPAKNLGSGINSGSWESQPSYSADGRTLYFVRGKRSARGIREQDIYYCYLMDNGRWSPAQKIPGRVNTIFEEESVMIHPDGHTLYFSSNGHPGMGGLDIYKSELLPNGEWDTPVNLGYPINTKADENSIQVTASGNVALFASEREGGFGGLDLYSFELHSFARPRLVTYIAGIITDKNSFKKLGAKVELIDLETGKQIAETYSNGGSGDYLICIPSGKDYALNVSKEGYLFHSENFSLKEYKSTQPYQLNVQLQKLKVGANVVLNNVFFNTNSFELLTASRVELDKLTGLLQANPNVKIEIGGHTDNVGNDQANQVLSENRAKAVAEYLIKKGIDPSKVTYKGYGEIAPIDSNDTESGRARNRRTEFKVVE